MPRIVVRNKTFSLKSNNVLTGITVPNAASLNPTAAVALEISFKPVAGGSMTLFDNSQLGVTNSYYAFVDGTGDLYWYSVVGGVAKNIIGGGSKKALLNEWNMVHFVYDGSFIRIFLNGQQVNSLAATGALGTNSGPLRIAAYYSGGVAQTCIFTKPRIYARAFTLQDHKDRFFLDRDDAAMRSGIVLDMPFNEGTGTSVADVSGFNNNGTFSAPVWSTDSPFGGRPIAQNFAGSIVSNGLSANAAVSVSNVGITGSYSYGGWFIWAGENGAGQVLMGLESTPSNPNIGATRNALAVSMPWTSGAVITIPVNFVPGLWVHIISTFNIDTGTSTTYFNGRMVDRRTGTLFTPYSVQKVHILRHPGTGLPVQGAASDAYVWDRDLTATEVQNLYQNRDVPSSGLRVYYDMSNQTGTTVTDRSINANNATIVTPNWSLSAPSKSRAAATSRIATRNFLFSLKMDGLTTSVTRNSPTGLPTGTSARSVATYVNFASDQLQHLVDLHVNGAQSFAPILGQAAGVYYWFSDVINAGNNLTMTRDEFYRFIGIGNWHQILWTYDGATTVKLYIDGVLRKTGTLGVAINTGAYNALYYGKGKTSGGADTYFTYGLLDELAIFNAELTANEVANYFLLNQLPASAVLRWPVQEGSGTSVADVIGTNTGTITAATWNQITPFKERVAVT